MTINRTTQVLKAKGLVKLDLATAEERTRRGDLAGALQCTIRALRNMQTAVNAYAHLTDRPRRKVRP